MTITLRAPTELTGRPLLLARLAWLGIFLLHIGAFLLSVPIRLAESPQLVPPDSAVPPAQFLAGLAQLGISPDAYIAFLHWGDIVIAGVYLLLGAFIFWRKSNDWMALPLRRRVQDILDRRFYRRKYNAQQVLQDFTQTVRDETNLDNLTGHLLQVVDDTMQPRSASLWLTGSEGPGTLSAVGKRARP